MKISKNKRVRSVTMTFYLPEDQYELNTALNSAKTESVLHDVARWLRDWSKHSGSKKRDGHSVYEEFLDHCRDYDIDPLG